VQNPKRSKKTISQALLGMYGHGSSKEDISALFEALRQKQDPIIHDDSTSGWMHTPISKFGLTVGDIRHMKFGQTMHVLFMDRNVGDYTDSRASKTFNPSKVGFSYGTYIHGENLTGFLNLNRVGVVHAPDKPGTV
jgi:hypothetical protein